MELGAAKTTPGNLAGIDSFIITYLTNSRIKLDASRVWQVYAQLKPVSIGIDLFAMKGGLEQLPELAF